MKFLWVLFFALVLPFTASQAALITVDSPLGPATAVQDTESNLEWLKPPLTVTPFNDLSAELGSGGKFEGYRPATATEFLCTLIGANTQLACNFGGRSTDLEIIEDAKLFVQLFFGEVTNLNGGYHAIEFPTEMQPLFFAQGAGFFFREANGQPFPEVEFDSQQVLIPSSAVGQFWLVREVRKIPVPSTYFLLGAGITALVISRKKYREMKT